MELSTIVKVKQGSEHELHIGFRDKVNTIILLEYYVSYSLIRPPMRPLFINTKKLMLLHYYILCMQEVNNIYGMFRTRSLLHQKAYQHSKGKLIDLM